MKQPRKLKKALKNVVVCYDIKSSPFHHTTMEVLDLFHKSGVLVYNSSKGDKPTILVGKPNKRIKIVNRPF